MRNGFNAALVDEETRRAWLEELDAIEGVKDIDEIIRRPTPEEQLETIFLGEY